MSEEGRILEVTAREHRALTELIAAQQMAGDEPTRADLEAALRVLRGEAIAVEVIEYGLAQLEAEHGITR